MSRSAARFQADKGGRRPSIHVTTPRGNTPQDYDTNDSDIIPGHLTLFQWTDMLRQEEVEGVVGQIMEDLMDRIMNICLDIFNKKQVIYFTTSWAKRHLVRIVEQHFLCKDEVTYPEEAFKTEDSEPMPANPDVWAQGCFSVVHANLSPGPFAPQEAEKDMVHDQTQTRVNRKCNVKASKNISQKQTEIETSLGRPLCHPTPPNTSRKKIKQDVPLKLITEKKLPPSLCLEEKTQKQSVKRTRSVSGHKTEISNIPKDNHFLPKLDSTLLPKNWVIPHFEILNDSYAKVMLKKPSGQPKQQTEGAVISLTSLQPLSSYRDQMRNEADFWLRRSFPSKYRSWDTTSSSASSTQGISHLDYQAMERNTLKFKPHAQSTKLKPIKSEGAVPTFSVDRLLTAPQPPATPLFQL